MTFAANAREASGFVVVGGALALGFLLVSLTFAWDDGVVIGTVLLFLAYVGSLLFGGHPLDRSAPVVAAGLIAVVELASWSLELRDGAEERYGPHLGYLVVLLFAAAAVSGFVLAIGGAGVKAGLAFVVLGAAAAIALVALITASVRDH